MKVISRSEILLADNLRAWRKKRHLGLKQMVDRRRPLIVAFVVSFLVFTDASALMEPLATTTLVDRAECIVEGQVTNVTSRWTDDHSRIVTEVTLDVTDILLGDTNRVTFLYEGGVVNGLGLRVSDMPMMTKGQHVLVFLRSQTPTEAKRDQIIGDRSRSFALQSAAQGLYRIENGRAKKDGFTVLGDPQDIDRDVPYTILKERIQNRLRTPRTIGIRP